jgi:hypothetical protein
MHAISKDIVNNIRAVTRLTTTVPTTTVPTPPRVPTSVTGAVTDVTTTATTAVEGPPYETYEAIIEILVDLGVVRIWGSRGGVKYLPITRFMETATWDPCCQHEAIDVFLVINNGIHRHLSQAILPPILLLDPDVAVTVSESESPSVEEEFSNLHTLVSSITTATVSTVTTPKAIKTKQPLQRSARLAANKLEVTRSPRLAANKLEVRRSPRLAALAMAFS